MQYRIYLAIRRFNVLGLLSLHGACGYDYKHRASYGQVSLSKVDPRSRVARNGHMTYLCPAPFVCDHLVELASAKSLITMAGNDEDSFQQFMYRFEDEVLSLAYYIKDRDLICSKKHSVTVVTSRNSFRRFF